MSIYRAGLYIVIFHISLLSNMYVAMVTNDQIQSIATTVIKGYLCHLKIHVYCQ